MTSADNFRECSYKRHAAHFRDCASGGKEERQGKLWLETDTVDAWRHARMYAALDPLLAHDPEAVWLTVGDGRYGKDAHYILEKGCQALASDISDDLLKEAVHCGFIPRYRRENAEFLSFDDHAFDYVLCKESYHHFPRPMIALYEMLRVSRKGVVLIEPRDSTIHTSIPDVISVKARNLLKRILGKNRGKEDFEPSGNYVYGISKREIEKVALGLNYAAVAFKGLNDSYFPGVENEKIAANGPLFRKVRAKIAVENLICALGLMDYAILVAVIFKTAPAEPLRRSLSEAGFRLRILPKNPYVTVE